MCIKVAIKYQSLSSTYTKSNFSPQVIKGTGFMKGLFTADELVSDNVKVCLNNITS